MAALRFKTQWSQLTSHAADIAELVGEVAKERLKEAGKHAASVMKKNLGSKGPSSPGQYPGQRTGFLRRKIGHKLVKSIDDPYVIVGSKSPHAHLLEFGHGDGKERNKRPFINRSLDEAQAQIEKILSERYF